MFQMCNPLPLPEGLTAFLLPEGPAMWHEFALGLDFADPLATIDLLLAADAITSRADCDRATAALILAKAMEAGFHRGGCPPGYVEEAVQAFAIRLSADLAAGRFPVARFALPVGAARLVDAQLSPFGLMPPTPGGAVHLPRYLFSGWQPFARSQLARTA